MEPALKYGLAGPVPLVRPSSALPALPQTKTLGLFAEAIENSPVATLTAVGALLGGVWGALAGVAAAAIVDADRAEWATIGAVIGGAALGVKGYSDGQELDQWLKQHS